MRVLNNFRSQARRVARKAAKSALEKILPQVERFTGFQTAPGDYLPNRLRILTGVYEEIELRAMGKFLRPRQIVFDVGANVGYLARFFARKVGSAGRIYAFEPNPAIFSLLQRNLDRLPQVRTLNFGLSNHAEELSLYRAGDDHSVASFAREFAAGHARYQEGGEIIASKARVIEGDAFAQSERVAHIDILKIDVEGWELQVLSGLTRTIEASREIVVFCEFNPRAQQCAGRNTSDLPHWFFEREFRLSVIIDKQLAPLSVATISILDDACRATGYTTLFAQHASSFFSFPSSEVRHVP